MKILIEKISSVVKYAFEPDCVITTTENEIITPEFVITDLNSTNVEFIEDVLIPEDWEGSKYCYVDGEFVLATVYLLATEKENMIKRIKQSANTELLKTDWYLLRHLETGKEVTDKVLAERQAIRAKSNELEAEVMSFGSLEEVLMFEVIY